MDPTTLSTVALIAAVATIAPLLSEATGRKVPSVVLELFAGILIGPQVLAIATETPTVSALAAFGLSFLFFMAGYEIEFAEIRGRPLELATIGWFVSLVLAIVIAGGLVFTGFAISALLIGLALTTTALGTLLPMLADENIIRRDLSRAQLFPMVLLSATALPLVVAITEIGLDAGRMKPENAAALVGAAMLSVLIFPFVAFTWRRRHPDEEEPSIAAPPDEPTTIYEDEADA